MPTCPLCLHANPDEASVCEHCGRFRFHEDEPQPQSGLTLSITRIREEQEPRLGAPDAPLAVMPTLPELPTDALPPKVPAKLVVLRGMKVNEEYPLYDGANYLGRTAERPADIDLSGLEPPEQVWASRQHAIVHCVAGALSLEDLNSLNGTFVNRARIYAGKKYALKHGDIIQIGTVQLKVVLHS